MLKHVAAVVCIGLVAATGLGSAQADEISNLAPTAAMTTATGESIGYTIETVDSHRQIMTLTNGSFVDSTKVSGGIDIVDESGNYFTTVITDNDIAIMSAHRLAITDGTVSAKLPIYTDRGWCLFGHVNKKDKNSACRGGRIYRGVKCVAGVAGSAGGAAIVSGGWGALAGGAVGFSSFC